MHMNDDDKTDNMLSTFKIKEKKEKKPRLHFKQK
jgi:hypothetical protein